MPVRSLTSSVLRWPDPESVHRAARARAIGLAAAHAEVAAVGCFGSYARGDAGVGSDLDLVVLIQESSVPFERRAAHWPPEALPVPADLLVYTLAEWQALAERRPLFFAMLRDEAQWLVGAPPPTDTDHGERKHGSD